MKPGHQSFRHRIDIGALPPGLYRVRLDTDAATSDHLAVDESGASVIQREE